MWLHILPRVQLHSVCCGGRVCELVLESKASQKLEFMVMETLGGSPGNASQESSWWAGALVVTMLAAVAAFLVALRNRRASAKLPPGPRSLPVIGNFHQLSMRELPHHTLWHMAEKFGPIMHLRMGKILVAVASSAEAAQEFLKAQDKSWASRPVRNMAGKVFINNPSAVGIAPYGPHWRHLRKICVTEIFSPTKLESFRSARTEEIGLMVKSVYEDSVQGKDVPLAVKLTLLALNNVTRMLMGRRLFEVDAAGEQQAFSFKNLILKTFTLVTDLPVYDCFPWLKWTARLNGFLSNVHRVKNEMDAFLQTFFAVSRKPALSDNSRVEKDLANLLPAQRSQLDKGLKVDILLAGIDNYVNSMEWTLALLLQHPPVLRKLQAELDTVVGTERIVSESDLPNLPYLEAIVKEMFRLYPPTPLDIPHESTEPTNVWGYEFPAKTMLFVNFYAIHRDPSVWERPLEFDPERFIAHPEIDVKGNHFELLPFGAGRRQCPATSFALVIVQMAVARLVQAFDIGLPDGMAPEDLDMTELFRATIGRKVPLVVVAKARLAEHLY